MNYKKVGIIIADIDEYKPFVNAVAPYMPKEIEIFGYNAVNFIAGGTQVLCCNCRIGKVNAASVCAYLISSGCECILNYGLSGGIDPEKTQAINIPERFLEHDFDFTPLGYKVCEKPLQDYIYESDPKLNELFGEIMGNHSGGTAVCGDSFICSKEVSERLLNNFDAVSCDMETAAIASVCHDAKVPFCCVRFISDNANESAIEDYRGVNADNSVPSKMFLSGVLALCKTEEK